MFIRQLSDRLRQSFWFIPALGIVLAVAASAVMLALSSELIEAQAHLPLIFGGGPEGARGMLQAIAGSVTTVAGVVFSITIVALQLTSTQFSPRVLRNFMRDRPTQVTLAVFMATIVYALLVLRTIRSPGPNGEATFVPGLAVTGALLLAFVSLGMLIFFIHHIGVRIQASSIIEAVTVETLTTLDGVSHRFDQLRREEGARQGAEGRVAGANGGVAGAKAAPGGPDEGRDEGAGGRPVTARDSGYLQYLEIGGLLHVAAERDLLISCAVPPGGWVQQDAPLFHCNGAGAGGEVTDDQLADWLVDKAALGSQRSMQQDVGFGIQQLVDVAVKALSPGINDPTTATQCIDRLTQLLVAVGTRQDPPEVIRDDDGAARLVVRFPGFDALLGQAVEQIRHYGAGAPVVVRHVAISLGILQSALPPQRHAAIRREATRLAFAARGLDAEDREVALAPLEPILGRDR